MTRNLKYRAQAFPLLRYMSLVGTATLGIFLASFLRVDAQAPSPKHPAEAANSTKTPVKNSTADSNLVWVDSQVVWEEIRNPFTPQATMALNRQLQVDSATSFPAITGIISSKEAGNRAILDGMVVRPGDRLKNFLVKEITKDKIILQGDETYALVLKPHQTPAIKIFLIPASGKGAQEIVLKTASETTVQNEGKEKQSNVEP